MAGGKKRLELLHSRDDLKLHLNILNIHRFKPIEEKQCCWGPLKVGVEYNNLFSLISGNFVLLLYCLTNNNKTLTKYEEKHCCWGP